jgi:prepilin-type N-terminal cleavage/methylation domain-containing protein/prepilin-type processing-associated H-X9-DG protein
MKSTRRAFTLIELLVALSILAILFSILLPALAAARVEGLKTKCLSRLRALAQTASAYSTDDSRGVYGPVHPLAAEYNSEGYADYGGGPGIVNLPNDIGQAYMWGNDFDPTQRPFNQMIFGVGGVAAPGVGGAGDMSQFEGFRCPGEEFGYQEWPDWQAPPEEVEHPYFIADGTSYRMNNLIWGEPGKTHWVGGVYGRAVSQIPDSSVTIGFMEARAFQTIYTNDTWGFLPVHGELTGYHKRLGYFNLSYADGHAAFADMGNGTYAPQTVEHSFFDVRGTWGRMDCLPDKMFLDD